MGKSYHFYVVGLLVNVLLPQVEKVVRNWIKVERAKHDITQEYLAEQVGVSRQTINAIEKGKYIPSTILALKIAEFLNVSFEQLFELEQDD